MSAGNQDSKPISPGGPILAPQPLTPGTDKSSGCLKSCLIAGVILVVVSVLGVVVFGVVAGSKFKDWEAMFLEQSKSTYMGYLSKDHTGQERRDFEKTYDEFTNSIKVKGVLATAREHEAGLLLLNQIIQDQKITREESSQFIEGWNKPGAQTKKS